MAVAELEALLGANREFAAGFDRERPADAAEAIIRLTR